MFQLQKKGHGAMQKLFMKGKTKRNEKMDKCPRYLKQWVLRCPPEKEREMNKRSHVFLQKCPGYLKQWVLRCPPEKKEMNKIAPAL